MKLRYSFILICAFVFLFFAGCSKTSESAVKMANEFLTQFYDINMEKSVEIMNSIYACNESKTENKLVSAHNVFKPFMTEEALNRLKANRMYGRNILFCAKNACSLKLKQLDLDQTFYDKKERKIGFNYTASVEIAYRNDKKQETEKGYIALQEKNHEWLIYSSKITGTSKTLININ